MTYVLRGLVHGATQTKLAFRGLISEGFLPQFLIIARVDGYSTAAVCGFLYGMMDSRKRGMQMKETIPPPNGIRLQTSKSEIHNNRFGAYVHFSKSCIATCGCKVQRRWTLAFIIIMNLNSLEHKKVK